MNLNESGQLVIFFFPYYIAVEEKSFRGKKKKKIHTPIYTSTSIHTRTLQFQSQMSSLQYCKYQDSGVTMTE